MLKYDEKTGTLVLVPHRGRPTGIKKGRPRKSDELLRACTAMLGEGDLQFFTKLGNGNLSEGVRNAAALLRPLYEKEYRPIADPERPIPKPISCTVTGPDPDDPFQGPIGGPSGGPTD